MIILKFWNKCERQKCKKKEKKKAKYQSDENCLKWKIWYPYPVLSAKGFVPKVINNIE